MTQETTSAPEPTEPGPEQPDGPQGAEEAQERPDSGNREAARYRRQLRETEAERDRLRDTVTGYRRAEAERYAEAAGLHRGGDLFDVGTDLGELLGDDGRVDPEKVTAAAAAVLAERPHWRRRAPSVDQGVMPSTPKAGPSWHDVLSEGAPGGR